MNMNNSKRRTMAAIIGAAGLLVALLVLITCAPVEPPGTSRGPIIMGPGTPESTNTPNWRQADSWDGCEADVANGASCASDGSVRVYNGGTPGRSYAGDYKVQQATPVPLPYNRVRFQFWYDVAPQDVATDYSYLDQFDMNEFLDLMNCADSTFWPSTGNIADCDTSAAAELDDNTNVSLYAFSSTGRGATHLSASTWYTIDIASYAVAGGTADWEYVEVNATPDLTLCKGYLVEPSDAIWVGLPVDVQNADSNTHKIQNVEWWYSETPMAVPDDVTECLATPTPAPTSTPDPPFITEVLASQATPCVDWNLRHKCGANDEFVEIGSLTPQALPDWYMKVFGPVTPAATSTPAPVTPPATPYFSTSNDGAIPDDWTDYHEHANQGCPPVLDEVVFNEGTGSHRFDTNQYNGTPVPMNGYCYEYKNVSVSSNYGNSKLTFQVYLHNYPHLDADPSAIVALTHNPGATPDPDFWDWNDLIWVRSNGTIETIYVGTNSSPNVLSLDTWHTIAWELLDTSGDGNMDLERVFVDNVVWIDHIITPDSLGGTARGILSGWLDYSFDGFEEKTDTALRIDDLHWYMWDATPTPTSTPVETPDCTYTLKPDDYAGPLKAIFADEMQDAVGGACTGFPSTGTAYLYDDAGNVVDTRPYTSTGGYSWAALDWRTPTGPWGTATPNPGR